MDELQNLRVKILSRAGPVAVLCDGDSPITYWNEPLDAVIRLASRDRWNSNLPGIHGGQYEAVVTQAEVDAARARFEALTGRSLPVVVCASMNGRIEA